MDATLLLDGGEVVAEQMGGMESLLPRKGGKEAVLGSTRIALVEQIADDRDQSKNSMKFPVTSLFKSDSRGTVSGTHVGV